MLSTTEDPRKLEITLRHYEEDYTSQAVKAAKLQAEIVHLRANIDYLEQCLAEERAQHKSESASVEPTMTSGALALNTPPMSDRGSIAHPLAHEDSVQSLGIADSPLPVRSRNATVTYSRKRSIAPDRDQSHHREASPEEKPGPSNLRKREKSVVHVLIPPLSEEKRRAFSKVPMSAYEEEPNRAGPSRSSRAKRERDDSVQPVQPAEHKIRHLRARSRELSYLDPPVPTRASSRVRTSRAQGSGGANRTQNGDSSKHTEPLAPLAAQPRDPPRVLRPLPRRSAHLRAVAPVPASPATRASADAVDRLGDISSLEFKISDKSLLDRTASRAQLSAVLGGAATRTCVSINGRNLLYSSHEFQLWRPSKPGGPGLLLYPTPEQPWQGDVQTVFVALYMAKYRYAGEYRLTEDEPLSPDEFNALPLALKQKWANHIAQTVQYKEIRVRIATRRDKAREATMQEVMTVANDTKNLFRGTVTAEDVLRAYENGDERMHVWRMACVQFDEAFLRNLVESL